jgi:hypothetical protein
MEELIQKSQTTRAQGYVAQLQRTSQYASKATLEVDGIEKFIGRIGDQNRYVDLVVRQGNVSHYVEVKAWSWRHLSRETTRVELNAQLERYRQTLGQGGVIRLDFPRHADDPIQGQFASNLELARFMQTIGINMDRVQVKMLEFFYSPIDDVFTATLPTTP